MKAVKIALLFILIVGLAAPFFWYITAENQNKPEYLTKAEETDADLPPSGAEIDKEEYLRLRVEQIELMRGFDTAKRDSRAGAIKKMEKSETELAASQRFSLNEPEVLTWKPLGPAPIPVSGSTSYSGRVSSIAVHPTNPNIVYVGTAQGGLYRTLNGGATWTPLLDNALSLAIGAVAISPSDPTTVFVGTGEAGLCSNGCFIGVGLYRITNADTNPLVSPVLNQGTNGGDVFSGRAISRIIVHPTNSNILFVASTSGIAGIGANVTGLVLPNAGIYRTTNAMAASPTFEKLAIQGTFSVTRSVIDLAIEPDNPNRLVAAVIGGGSDGGVYLSTDALGATPTFARTLTTGDGSLLGRTEFAVNKNGGVLTIYAATGTANGTLFKSIDGGATFTQAIANSFCGSQCFYDIAVAVDPNDANKVYLGGSPNLVFGRSIDGGTSFVNSSANLHVDTHAIAIAPSDTSTIYFGSDGGIWKSINGGTNWTSLNNSTFSATEFMSLSLHPTDRNYLLGGTQDNGTQFLAPDGASWIRSDGGDGGFAVIDQNSPNTTDVTAYHTYYNSTNSQIGFSRATTTVAPGDPNWGGVMGCTGSPAASNNGIQCADQVLFYAPIVVGPGTPNTLYFGTNHLYRSADKGTTMTDVSGVLSAPVSAIAISQQNDNVRLVGTKTGGVFVSTTAGSTTMTNITGSIPARYVGRAAIDPNNANVAYVALNGFGLAAGQHVWKTTNLLSATPTWAAAGNGIPDIPVNAFVVDSANTQQLFAGTDIGVFRSIDGGANWTPFSDGLPRVPVFGMEMQSVHRVLKIATHGRGIWEINLATPSSRTKFDYDGDGKADVSIYRPSEGNWYISNSAAAGALSVARFGLAADKIVPADYDGDGKTDYAIYRPAEGNWYLQRSRDGFGGVHLGASVDVPVAADYDGDGKTDIAVYRPAESAWYQLNTQSGFQVIQFGISTDKPTPFAFVP